MGEPTFRWRHRLRPISDACRCAVHFITRRAPQASSLLWNPMASLQLTTTLMGIGLAALILYLIRRDHLYVMHGLFWVFVASAAAFLGVWPGLIDKLASLVGISYPPALLLLLACIVLLVKALHSDMVNTRIERDVRRLNQRLALLQADIEAQRVAAEPSSSTEHLSV